MAQVKQKKEVQDPAKLARAQANKVQLNFRMLKFPSDMSGRLSMLKTACVVMGTIVKHDRAMDMVEALETMAAWVKRKSEHNLRSREERAHAALSAANVKRAIDAEDARKAAIKDAHQKIAEAKAARDYVEKVTDLADKAKAHASK